MSIKVGADGNKNVVACFVGYFNNTRIIKILKNIDGVNMLIWQETEIIDGPPRVVEAWNE